MEKDTNQIGLFYTSQFENNVASKRKQRDDRIAVLKDYQKPLTIKENESFNESVAGAVKHIQNNNFSPREVLKTHDKKAMDAHVKTYALTEVMFTDAEK